MYSEQRSGTAKFASRRGSYIGLLAAAAPRSTNRDVSGVFPAILPTINLCQVSVFSLETRSPCQASQYLNAGATAQIDTCQGFARHQCDYVNSQCLRCLLTESKFTSKYAWLQLHGFAAQLCVVFLLLAGSSVFCDGVIQKCIKRLRRMCCYYYLYCQYKYAKSLRDDLSCTNYVHYKEIITVSTKHFYMNSIYNERVILQQECNMKTLKKNNRNGRLFVHPIC